MKLIAVKIEQYVGPSAFITQVCGCLSYQGKEHNSIQIWKVAIMETNKQKHQEETVLDSRMLITVDWTEIALFKDPKCFTLKPLFIRSTFTLVGVSYMRSHCHRLQTDR